MTTEQKRIVLNKIIELSKLQDHNNIKNSIKNDERDELTQEAQRLITAGYNEIINIIEYEKEFLTTLLFDLF